MTTGLTALDRYIEDQGLHVGGTLTLTADQLREFGVIPRLDVNRVTYWDPVMGKGNSLQSLMSKHVLFPVAFEWGGRQERHPTLASVTLKKWGSTQRNP